jgi:5-hydroxyisourate hydrolase-like protein (transthyretin family)
MEGNRHGLIEGVILSVLNLESHLSFCENKLHVNILIILYKYSTYDGLLSESDLIL